LSIIFSNFLLDLKVDKLNSYASSLGESIGSAQQLLAEVTRIYNEVSADTEMILAQEQIDQSKGVHSMANISAMDDAALEAMLSGLPRQSDF
jgi:hypothetical protein